MYNLAILIDCITFSLTRIKINFTIAIQENEIIKLLSVPGELFDLCMAKKNDRKFSKSKENYYENILIKNINKNINIQSRDGLIFALIEILFPETKYKPWNDEKYKKRIKRLILLVLLNLLDDTNRSISLKQKISQVELIINIIKNDFNSSIKNINFYDNNLKSFVENIKITFDNKDTESIDNFNLYKQLILEYINILLIILKMQYNQSLNKGYIYRYLKVDISL